MSKCKSKVVRKCALEIENSMHSLGFTNIVLKKMKNAIAYSNIIEVL